MAYVKIKFHKNSDRLLDYAHKGRDEKDPYHAELVSRGVEQAKWEFHKTRELFNASSPNQCIHVVQSFHPLDSPNMTTLQAIQVGTETVRRAFPGHQFHVVPHTDRKHLHNHIIVNSVNHETGAVIMNKKRYLSIVRELSNEVCKEHGLRTIEQKDKTRDPTLPEKAVQISKRGGYSYVIDMKQKASFALAHAKTFKEYEEILGSFGITMRVTDKNLTYFYPERERGKRGDKLGKQFTVEGVNSLMSQKTLSFRHETGNSQSDLSTKQEIPVPANPVSLFKSLRTLVSPSRVALTNSVVSKDEIVRASSLSVEDYARRRKLDLIKDSSDRLVMKDKPFLEIKQHRWINHRNGTQGNLIDFVFVVERSKSYTHALASITGNPDLLKLKEFAEQSDKFRAFLMKDEKAKTTAVERLKRMRQAPKKESNRETQPASERIDVFQFLEELEKELPAPTVDLAR